MEESKKTDNGSLSKKHFAKLHQRIQDKYVEMQKKIERSKSLESLLFLNNDNDFNNDQDLTGGQRDNGVLEKVASSEITVKHSVIVEDVTINDVAFDVVYEAPIYNIEVTPALCEDEGNVFFGDNFLSSFESNNEANNGHASEKSKKIPNKDETEVELELIKVPENPHKASLRYRLGEKIIAAREKRKEYKEKKKERDKLEKLLLSNKPERRTSHESIVKKKIKQATVTVAVIEATREKSHSTNDRLFCRIRLGTEKRKTKLVKCANKKIVWQEMFNMNLYDEYLLEINVWDRDNLIGRAVIDLFSLEKEKTHKIRRKLEDCVAGLEIFLLVTITGTPLDNIIVDLEDYKKMNQRMLLFNFSDVGKLTVHVYGAQGLPISDSYCIVELINNRAQTQTEYKTTDPNWMKYFNFEVSDITAILYITVVEEKKSEILGKICIPLLNIENGKQKWYALKDANLLVRAKGNNPKILLEMRLYYHPVTASLRILTPKEQILLKQEPQFDRHVFFDNVTRAKVVVSWILDAVKVIKTLFEWDNPVKNIVGLIIWLFFWWIYKDWMLPLLFLAPFIWYRPKEYHEIQGYPIEPDTDLPEEKKKDRSYGPMSLRQRFQSLTDLIAQVQNDVGNFASLGESVKNLYNFTVPFVSWVAIVLILLVTIVVFLTPPRYLFMVWGLYKYIRKILHPNRIASNEILDLLSRVPDDETVQNTAELPLLEEEEQEPVLGLE